VGIVGKSARLFERRGKVTRSAGITLSEDAQPLTVLEMAMEKFACDLLRALREERVMNDPRITGHSLTGFNIVGGGGWLEGSFSLGRKYGQYPLVTIEAGVPEQGRKMEAKTYRMTRQMTSAWLAGAIKEALSVTEKRVGFRARPGKAGR